MLIQKLHTSALDNNLIIVKIEITRKLENEINHAMIRIHATKKSIIAYLIKSQSHTQING